MKLTRPKAKNILFFVFIAIIIIPQTREPIQIFINKGLALFSPSEVKETNRKQLLDYNWQLIDINDNTTNLNASKNKVILVNLWATWCPPCIAEMPSLDKLYADYKDKVDFYFVSNEKPDVLKSFLDKNNYQFNVHIAQSKYPEVFDVSSIPRTYLIDKNGYMIFDKKGAANWNSETVRNTIDKLLNDL
jgi:thiol-disulfide isomerase/thioredoxin